MDINFSNVISANQFSVNIPRSPGLATGNKLLANIFEITLFTNINNSLFSYGYGTNGIDMIKSGYDPNDTQSIASTVKVACDNTVAMMKIDQDEDPSIPKNEKIASASVESVIKNGENVAIQIRIIPEEFDDTSAGLVLAFPL